MRELTAEEQANLESLTDPDVIKPKFAWDDTFQRKLLGMLLTDQYMLVQSVDKIQPIYFANESHVLICKILINFFNKHKTIPDKWIITQELNDILKDKDKSVTLYHQAELNSLYDYYVPGVDSRDYLLDKITYFAKVQGIKVAFHNCVEKMNEAPESEETWSFVYEEMRKAMTVDRSYTPGLEYFLNIEEMYSRMEDQFKGKNRYTSGFDSIDRALAGGGLFNGELGSWIGLGGSGKSLALCKAAVANVLLNHKVLYLTMEMDELGISKRFTSQFAKVDINALKDCKDQVLKTIEEFGKDQEDKNLLIIKQFPGGTIDVNGIRSFYSQLEVRGWKPNLIIVDYVGEMKDDPGVQKYESAYRILRDLRGFGVEKQHCTFTCIQPNISAAKLEIHQFIDESNIGTSFDQFKPLDALWSINQQPIEKDAEVGRVYVVKHRNGKSKYSFKLGFDFNLGTLDIFEISKERYGERMNKVQAEKAEEVPHDKVPEKKKKRKNSVIEDDEET